MKKNKVREKFLEELERTPIIIIACEKVGVTRNSVYRWMKEDPEFLHQVNESLEAGTGLVNDIAESNVLTGIKNKSEGYTKYWLSHRHSKFKRPFIYRDDNKDILERNNRMEALKAEKEVDEWVRGWTTLGQKSKQVESKKIAKEILAKWKDVMAKGDEERAKELFEQWKAEERSKNKTT